MKIYTVRTVIYHEGGYLEGVFDSYEKAKEYAYKCKNEFEWGDETVIEEYEINTVKPINKTTI